MRVLYINNDGGGFADHIEIAAGTTVAQLFDERVEGRPDDYLIRVNRLPAARDQVLRENDRISFTGVPHRGRLIRCRAPSSHDHALAKPAGAWPVARRLKATPCGALHEPNTAAPATAASCSHSR